MKGYLHFNDLTLNSVIDVSLFMYADKSHTTIYNLFIKLHSEFSFQNKSIMS